MGLCGSKNGDQNTVCLKEIGVRPHNLLTIPISIFNVKFGIWGRGERGRKYRSFEKKVNPNFDDEHSVHISSKIYEENDYMLD